MADKYVATTGDDDAAGTIGAPYRTIQKGVNSIGNGDTCYVRAGTYVEAINITSAGAASAIKTLKNYNSETVIIDGQAGVGSVNAGEPSGGNLINDHEKPGAVFVPGQNYQGWDYMDLGYRNDGLLDITCSHWRVEGIEIKRSMGRGIRIYTSNGGPTISNIYLKDIEVHETRSQIILVQNSGHANGGYKITNITLDGIHAYDSQMDGPFNRGGNVMNWGAGISFSQVHGCLIKNCEFHDCWGEALFIQSTGAKISGNTIWTCEDFVVQNCKSYNNMKGAIVMQAVRNILIDSCLTYHSPDSEKYNSSGITIEGNEPQLNKAGTADTGVDGVTVQNCICVGNASNITIRGAQKENKNITIINNTLVNAIGVGGVGLSGAGTWGGTNTFRNNIIIQNPSSSTPVVGTGGPNLDSTWRTGWNHWTTAPTRAIWTNPSNDLLGDPLLVNHTVALVGGSVDPTKYKLLNGSPCIGAAKTSDMPDDDFWGTARGNDIGAHEYGTSTATVSAAFSGTPLSGTLPLTVQFTDASSATNGIASRNWSFGDGGNSTQTNPSHTYLEEGTYTVSLTVSANGNIEDTETKTDYVTVSAPVVGGGVPSAIKVGRFAVNTSTGNQVVPHTLEKTPKAILAFPTGGITSGTVEDGALLGVGCATAAGEVWSIGTFSDHGEPSLTDTQAYCRDDRFLSFIGAISARIYTATLGSWSDSSFTVNWQEAPTSPWKVPYMIFGGDDVTADAIVFDSTYGANWDQVANTATVTLGYRPDLVLAFGCNSASAAFTGNAKLAMGISVDGGEDNAIAYRNTTAQSAGDPRAQHFAELIGFTDGTYVEIGYTATGIELTPRVNTLGGPVMLLCMKLDSTDIWSDIINSPTGAGNVDYSAPGFNPQALLVFLSALQAETTGYTDANAGSLGVYMLDTDGNEFNNAISSEDAALPTNEQSLTDNNLAMLADDGTIMHEATAGSFLSTGWRWPTTTADGTARKWLALAIKNVSEPTALFSLNVIQGIYGETVFQVTDQANANGLGTIVYSYDWDDGSDPDTAAEPSHTYADEGTYTVTQTITVGSFVSTYSIDVVVIPPAPVAAFTITVNNEPVTKVSQDETVLFSAVTSTPGGNEVFTAFAWEIYTGNAVSGNKVVITTSTAEYFTHQFTADGIVTVSLLVTQSGTEVLTDLLVDVDALEIATLPTIGYLAQPIGDAVKVGDTITGETPLTIAIYDDTNLYGFELITRTFEIIDSEGESVAVISGVEDFYWTFLEAGTFSIRQTVTTPAGTVTELTTAVVTTTLGTNYIIGPPVPGTLTAVTQNVQRGDWVHTHEVLYTDIGDPSSIMGTTDQGGTGLNWLTLNHEPQDFSMRVANWRLVVDGNIGFSGNRSGIGSMTGDDVKLYSDLIPDVGYAVSLGAAQKKIKEIHAAAFFIETLVAQEVKADIGGRVIVGATNTLTKPAITQFGGDRLTVKYNNVGTGDILWFEGEGKFEMIKVLAEPIEYIGADDYLLYVQRAILGTLTYWDEGTAFVNTGNWRADDGQLSPTGFIDLFARRSIKTVGGGLTSTQGPTIVGNVRYGASPLHIGEAWAIGDLDNFYGYTSQTWGVGLGLYELGEGTYQTLDNVNGLRYFSSGDGVMHIAPDRGIMLISDITGPSNQKRRLSFVDDGLTEHSWLAGYISGSSNNLNMQQESVTDKDSGTYIVANAPAAKNSVIELHAAKAGVYQSGIVISRQGSTNYISLNANEAGGSGGEIILLNLPTSSTGLTTGALWNSAGTLKIKT